MRSNAQSSRARRARIFSTGVYIAALSACTGNIGDAPGTPAMGAGSSTTGGGPTGGPGTGTATTGGTRTGTGAGTGGGGVNGKWEPPPSAPCQTAFPQVPLWLLADQETAKPT